MPDIHPSAIVESGAEVGEGVRIGPFCLVGPQAVIGDGFSAYIIGRVHGV